MTVKPLIKWAGAKNKLLDTLFRKFPTIINNYHEIFLGSGCVLYRLLEEIEHSNIRLDGQIYAYDKNAVLIYFHINIQQNPEEFIQKTLELCNDYNDIEELNGNRTPNDRVQASESKESFYYWCRTKFNAMNEYEKTSVEWLRIILLHK